MSSQDKSEAREEKHNFGKKDYAVVMILLERRREGVERRLGDGSGGQRWGRGVEPSVSRLLGCVCGGWCVRGLEVEGTLEARHLL